MEGVIKRLNGKGFGFILGSDDLEYFFHQSTCMRGVEFNSLREGDRVKFIEGDGPKGPRAEEVELI